MLVVFIELVLVSFGLVERSVGLPLGQLDDVEIVQWNPGIVGIDDRLVLIVKGSDVHTMASLGRGLGDGMLGQEVFKLG